MEKILITGGTGLIGSHLCPRLKEKGYEPILLSRKNKSLSGFSTLKWDPENDEIDDEALKVDYIIHLAGENLGEKKWTAEQKKAIFDSRVKTANLLFKKVKESGYSLKAFISSSAIGYYGTAPLEVIFKESDPPGKDFLSQVCIEWEKAADQFQSIGIRTVKIRSGVVLTRSGGVLEEMKKPIRFGIASPLGSGKQYMPWIHIKDLCSIYIKALEDSQMKDSYNAVAPDQETNAEFMLLLAQMMNKPFWFPKVPSFMLKAVLGERAEMVLSGNRVADQKIIQKGFVFKFPTLSSALQDLLS